MTHVIDMSNPRGNEASLKKFKPKWYNGTTQTIRVPIALANQILDYAHKLDESLLQVNDFKQELEPNAALISREVLVQTLTRVIETLEYFYTVDRYTKRSRSRLTEEAIVPLQALLQVIKLPIEDFSLAARPCSEKTTEASE